MRQQPSWFQTILEVFLWGYVIVRRSETQGLQSPRGSYNVCSSVRPVFFSRIGNEICLSTANDKPVSNSLVAWFFCPENFVSFIKFNIAILGFFISMAIFYSFMCRLNNRLPFPVTEWRGTIRTCRFQHTPACIPLICEWYVQFRNDRIFHGSFSA